MLSVENSLLLPSAHRHRGIIRAYVPEVNTKRCPLYGILMTAEAPVCIWWRAHGTYLIMCRKHEHIPFQVICRRFDCRRSAGVGSRSCALKTVSA